MGLLGQDVKPSASISTHKNDRYVCWFRIYVYNYVKENKERKIFTGKWWIRKPKWWTGAEGQLRTGNREKSLGIGLLCQDRAPPWNQGAMNIQPTRQGRGTDSAHPQAGVWKHAVYPRPEMKMQPNNKTESPPCSLCRYEVQNNSIHMEKIPRQICSHNILFTALNPTVQSWG